MVTGILREHPRAELVFVIADGSGGPADVQDETAGKE